MQGDSDPSCGIDEITVIFVIQGHEKRTLVQNTDDVLSAARNTAKAIHPQIKDDDTLIVLKDEERVGKASYEQHSRN